MISYCPICGAKLESRRIDGVARFACSNHQCRFVFWDNPVPVVTALVRYEGNYIIARNVKWPAPIFSFISGYLERGESPQQAVIREVKEELDLSGRISRLIGIYSFAEKNQLIICYEVEASGTIKLNHELAEYKLLSSSELASYDFGPLNITKKAINDWKNTN